MKKRVYSLIFTILLFFVFTWAAIEANSFSDLASFFPLFTAVISANIAFISIVLQSIQLYQARKKNKKLDEEETVEEDAPIGRVLYYVGWIAGFVVLIYLLGLIWATMIFLIAFFIAESKFKIWKALLFTAIVVVVLIVFGDFMNLYWPNGIINLGIF